MYIQAVDTLTAIIKKNIIKLNKNISIKSNNIRLTEVVLNARLQENFRGVYATGSLLDCRKDCRKTFG